jgi:hypothetical protein
MFVVLGLLGVPDWGAAGQYRPLAKTQVVRESRKDH